MDQGIIDTNAFNILYKRHEDVQGAKGKVKVLQVIVSEYVLQHVSEMRAFAKKTIQLKPILCCILRPSRVQGTARRPRSSFVNIVEVFIISMDIGRLH